MVGCIGPGSNLSNLRKLDALEYPTQALALRWHHNRVATCLFKLFGAHVSRKFAFFWLWGGTEQAVGPSTPAKCVSARPMALFGLGPRTPPLRSLDSSETRVSRTPQGEAANVTRSSFVVDRSLSGGGARSQNGLHTSRRLGRNHRVQSIPDAPPAATHGSVAAGRYRHGVRRAYGYK